MWWGYSAWWDDNAWREYNAWWEDAKEPRKEDAKEPRTNIWADERRDIYKDVATQTERRRCTICQDGIVPQRIKAASELGMCRKCWNEDGCRNSDGTLPPTCMERGTDCTVWLRAKGIARRNLLCMQCYQRLSRQTWKDINPGKTSILQESEHVITIL